MRRGAVAGCKAGRVEPNSVCMSVALEGFADLCFE
jgi:hypothetical protein